LCLFNDQFFAKSESSDSLFIPHSMWKTTEKIFFLISKII